MRLTEFQEAALILCGMATRLPEAERLKLDQIEGQIRQMLTDHGDLAKFAICLVGAELAAEL